MGELQRGVSIQFGVSVTPPTQSGWWLKHFSCWKPDIVGVADAKMWWGCFGCLSCCQRGRTLHVTLFYEALRNFKVLVSKLLEVVLHVGKGAKFGVQRVNSGQVVCSKVANVGSGKNCEKHAQCSKG